VDAAESNSLTPQTRAGSSTRTRGRLLVTLAATGAGFIGLVLLLYATSAHANAASSDRATTILVGQAMVNGHLLLHGWILPPGSYWTIDALFYAVAVGIGGLRPGLLYAEPAVVAALIVAVGVLSAREGRRGTAAFAGSVAVFALLALASPALAFFFLGRGFHVATGLYALLAFAALRRGRFGWGWVFAVALLAAGMLGDLQIVAYGVVPVLLAGFLAMLRERRWQSGLAEVTAAAASVAAAELVHRLADALGGFTPGPALPVAHLGQMLTNLGHLLPYGAGLLGLTNGLVGIGELPLALRVVHVLSALCVVTSFLAALGSLVAGVARGRPRGQAKASEPELWRLDDLLLIAVFSSAVPFLILGQANGPGVRYLTVTIVFASVLTGRMVARVWPKLPKGWAVRGLAILGMAMSLSFAAGVGYALSRPEPTPVARSLAAWLEAHKLRNGIGDYWAASITTVESSGAVTVRPVSVGPDGELQRTMNQSPASWYAGERFQFLVYDTPELEDVGIVSATKTWGAPTHIYVVGSYDVLVWGRPVTVAPFPSS